MFGFGSMIENLKKNPKSIVLTDGTDPRILEAASRLLASNFIKPVLLGKSEDIERSAEEAGYNIRGAEMIDPASYERFDEMVSLAEKLSKDMPHVRVDFYEVNGQVYFGEFTFYHHTGMVPFDPPAWDKIFGDWLKLPPVLL